MSARAGAADPRAGWANPGLLALLAAVAVAAPLRIALAHYSLWFDELASVFFASQPPARLWSGWMVRETNPPLFYTLLHGWIALFGWGEVRLRLLPIAASLLAMPVVFAGVRRAYGMWAAAVAALLLALSPQQLYFSHQVRAYMVLYLAIACSFFGLMRVVGAQAAERGRIRAGWAAYVAGAVVGIYLHTTAVVWPAAASLALLLADGRFRRPRGGWLGALVVADMAILAFAAWWLGITLLQLRAPAGNLGWMEVVGARKTALIFCANALLSRQIGPWEAAAPLVVAILAALGLWRTWDRVETRLTAACFLLAGGIFFLLQLRQPVMLDRTLFWLSLFPLTMVAVGAATLRGRSFAAAVAVLLATQVINLALLAPRLAREDWRPAVWRPAADPRAALLVEGEAMGIAAEMACVVERAGRPCPFPVVTLVGTGPLIDTWGRGYAPAAPARADRLLLPPDQHLYLFRRQFHDVAAEMARAGLVPSVPPVAAGPLLVGPLPGRVGAALVGRARVIDGLVRLSEVAAPGQGPAGTGTPRM